MKFYSILILSFILVSSSCQQSDTKAVQSNTKVEQTTKKLTQEEIIRETKNLSAMVQKSFTVLTDKKERIEKIEYLVGASPLSEEAKMNLVKKVMIGIDVPIEEQKEIYNSIFKK